MPAADLQTLQTKLGHTFRDRSLLVRALTHKSFSSETTSEKTANDNEQLEFFGDSILGFLVSEILVQQYPLAPEGELSRSKSHLVSARWLYQVAQSLELGDFLHLGKGEEHSGGRVKRSLLANAMEALIAALYLDGGLEAARYFVAQHVFHAEALAAGGRAENANFKGELWETAGARKLPPPQYRVLQTSGPPHSPSFVVEARLGELFTGTGTGPSKKAAEQSAARALLDAMGQKESLSPS